MAAGVPYLSSYGDALLLDALTDPLLAKLCPGGVSGQRPPDSGAVSSTVLFWLQSPGNDVARMDGQSGRAVSTHTYVVVAFDRQSTGSSKVVGTVGAAQTPPQPCLQLAQERIYDLLHGKSFSRGGFSYSVKCFAEYPRVAPLTQGGRDVQVGWWVRLTVT